MKKIGLLLISFILLLSTVFSTVAFADEQTVLRVAVLDYPRYMSVLEDGSFYGFGVEYLQHLGEYGNFTCEFIPMSLQEANEKIAAGEIDLIPGHRRAAEREAVMSFSTLPMNIDTNVLCCRADDDRFAYNDFDAYDGITVGLLAGSTLTGDIHGMETAHGIHVNIEVFEDNNSCYAALESGKADALIIGGFRLTEDLKILSPLSSSALYIACDSAQPDLLARINDAQSALWANEPEYSSQLWEKYYGDITESISLSGEEREYLSGHSTLNVGLLSSVPVLSDAADGSSKGALRDWFEQTYANTGFTFEFIPVPTMQELLTGLEDGSYDIIFPMGVPKEPGAMTENITLLEGQFPVTMVAVTKENTPITNITETSMVVARNDKAFITTLATYVDPSRFTVVDNPEKAMLMLQSGEVSIALMDSAAALYLMDNPRYEKMEIVPGYDTHILLSAGVSQSTDESLISIMNKYTTQFTTEATNNIILTASAANAYKSTPWDFIYRYRVTISIIFLLVALLVSTLVFIILRQRAFNLAEKRNAEALETARKAQLEAEEKNMRLSIQQEADNRLKQTLRFKAMHDDLTGIYNMNGFKEAVRLALQNNPDLDYMLVRLDLNRFSVFNDLFGMNAGNRLLCAIAQELDIRCNLSCDAYARLTDDHFALCIPQSKITEKELETTIHAWLRDYSPDYELQECIGIYYITDRSMDVSIMCDRASLAQQSVKGIYPSRIGVYHEGLRDEVLEEQWITANMRSALNTGEFLIFFQPQYRISTGELIGAEVLCRWQSPERGLIKPDHFIPIFEKNGFITELDAYIWNQACTWLKGRISAGLPVIPLSVNISRIDINNLDLEVFLPALVARYDLNPAMLRLEITESVFINHKDKMIDTLCELRKRGFYIELDDFGIGYTSINILRDLPIDMLKLDMSFLTGNDRFGRSGLITSAVIELAGRIHMEVLAEGVETQEQVQFLTGMGCDLAQGYHYSAPMSVMQFEALLNEKAK